MTIESDGWAFNVALIHLYRDVMKITEQATGMSQTRMEILHELYHNEEMSQAELQQHLGVEGAVVTRIIKQLEAAGLVTRRADPQDNRFTLVSMSAETRRMQTAAEGMQFRENMGKQLMNGLSDDERALLLDLMHRIQENVKGFESRNALGKTVK